MISGKHTKRMPFRRSVGSVVSSRGTETRRDIWGHQWTLFKTVFLAQQVNAVRKPVILLSTRDSVSGNASSGSHQEHPSRFQLTGEVAAKYGRQTKMNFFVDKTEKKAVLKTHQNLIKIMWLPLLSHLSLVSADYQCISAPNIFLPFYCVLTPNGGSVENLGLLS